ncbi:hypothetical protein, partial [Scytonema sp. PCC 10023]|uniref:hypothetical protein n=1 Tax=Scytonema sp. PCC 10023 TaxID=1680591 RepID=UPI0039C61549
YSTPSVPSVNTPSPESLRNNIGVLSIAFLHCPKKSLSSHQNPSHSVPFSFSCGSSIEKSGFQLDGVLGSVSKA